MGKMGRAQNTVKREGFLARRSGSAAGGAAPLSYGEERTAVRQCHGQGAPGRIFPFHIWDVILPIDFHSIIFKDGHIAPPTRI